MFYIVRVSFVSKRRRTRMGWMGGVQLNNEACANRIKNLKKKTRTTRGLCFRPHLRGATCGNMKTFSMKTHARSNTSLTPPLPRITYKPLIRAFTR